ncbi:zinc finger protein ZFP2-like [Maniola hyperantus]|uniref:zinc finger protein ZFP2-like n=1 Tax=Aphantopus hyperantus TaxID=2795564 RepID=UPI00374915CD
MRCSVPFCKTTVGGRLRIRGGYISRGVISRFPREENLRAAWLRALGKDDTLLPERAVVCSQHFVTDDIYETESGLKRFLCGQGKLRQTVCVQCAQRLVNFSTFRDKELESALLMMELLTDMKCYHYDDMSDYNTTCQNDKPVKHQLQSDIVSAVSEPNLLRRVIAHSDEDGWTELDATDEAVAVKREVEDCEDADTVHCAYDEDQPAEARNTGSRWHIIPTPESSGDCDQALVAPSVLATNHRDVELATDTDDESDILTFENNTNNTEYSRKSQDSVLKPQESLAKISDNISFRTTRRNALFKNKHNSQDILGTQLGNYTDQIQHICDVCQKIFQRKSSLVTHIRAHTFSCKLRERKFTQNSTSSSPRRTHTGEKPFACKLCKYKCTQKGNLVTHMRTHTGEKPFACKLCKYKCSENSSLVKHTRTHTGEKPFACKLCKYKCTVSSSLVSHMRIHTGEKPFACKLCKYKCTQNSYLVRHMRTHTGEKPFACKLCKYKCTRKDNLVQHMRTHTGEKPFACKLCKYKCTRKNNLVEHMRTHTGEKPFACKLCKYKCTVSRSLVSHMRTHH